LIPSSSIMASNISQSDGTPAAPVATQQSSNTPTATTVTALGPDDVLLTMQYINDNAWPADFELDIDTGNWPLWLRRISLLADRQGFTDWLDGTIPRPDKATHPKAHHIWVSNDRSLKAFLLSHVSQRDYDNACTLSTAHEVFEELRKTHEKQGIHAKLVLMTQAMNTRFRADVPLSKTLDDVRALHKRIIQMGPISDDQLYTIFLVNALNDIEALQSNVIGLANDSNFTSKDVVRRLLQEDQLVRRRAEQNTPTTSVSILAAQGQGKPRSLCTHCKKPGHLADFCIKTGGKMAGRSIEEARTAQRAASGKPPRAETASNSITTSVSSAKVAQSDTKVSGNASAATPESLVIGGVTYYPGAPSQPSNACIALPQPSAFITDSDDSGDSTGYSYHTYLAVNGPLKVSLDWSTSSSNLSDFDDNTSPVLSHVPRVLLTRAAECLFILDSGASNHISPE
jgi:gag-polypeptide of LTR copia-type